MSSPVFTSDSEGDHNRLVNQSQQQQQQNQRQQNDSPKNFINSKVRGILTSTPGTGSNNSSSGTNKTTTKTFLENSQTARNNEINQTNSILQNDLCQSQQIQEQKPIKGELNLHLAYANKGVEALGVLIQYLVYDLGAFSCPLIKKECAKTQKTLKETQLLVDEIKAKCLELQNEVQEKETYYINRETELKNLHRCELQRVESSLNELQVSAKERIASLETELASKDAASHDKFQEYVRNSEAKIIEQEKEITLSKAREEELLRRLNAINATENELREKILHSETSFAERLKVSSQRERELTEKINVLNNQLDALRHETENKEKELEEKLNLSRDEISVLRSSKNGLDQSICAKNGATNKVQMLQDEVESLRSVLELKQSEISELRKQNIDLQRAADELPAAQLKISAMESRIEDLQIQLKAKVEEEKELVQKNKRLQESYTHEIKNSKRLTLHNEELQWRLKQNSERFSLALTELSKSYQEQPSYLNVSKSSFSSQDNQDSSRNSSLTSLNRSINGSDLMVGCFQMSDVSPPGTPIIKGVVEKSDSVSWVLEMDDESPEVLASRMVRRAGSFRSSFNEKSPGTKRQYSLPATNNSVNPLLQSASATSVIRLHSNESAESQNTRQNQQSSRIRSKSVTINCSEKQQRETVPQNSRDNDLTARKIDLSAWQESVCSSSPYSKKTSPKGGVAAQSLLNASSRSSISPFRADNDSNDRSYVKTQRNLITCDTSALTSVERLRSSIPSSHPSVQDFKNLKKCQEIRESAGEAMVSGTNSEDEACSASSDETTSTSSASTSSLGEKAHLSIEDALLVDKISLSLEGTPMEVSWSDDVDQFPSESVV